MSNPKTTMYLGPWTIEAEQEIIEILDDSPQPDKGWRFIDANGHAHFWQDGYPTLKSVEVECYCSAVEEDHTVPQLECPHCGEVIVPNRRAPGVLDRRIEKGQLWVTLTYSTGDVTKEYQLSEQDGRAVMSDPVEAIPRVTAGLQPSSVSFMR